MVQRLLGVATEPLGIVLGLFLGGALLAWGGKRRSARAAFALAVALLWGAATPLVSDALSARIEGITPALPAGARGDALVILGGALAGRRPPRTGAELVDSSDRILTAARLFRDGRAPLVVVSGGSGPWGVSSVPESVEIAGLLVEWGVPREAILTETRSTTTRENAAETARLLLPRGARRILLVTSALHMPRSAATYRTVGFEVTPAPCDYLTVTAERRTLLDVLPSAGALAKTTAAWHEAAGLAYYRLRGWL